MAQERVQKILSQAGFGSRRGCEQIIDDGRVTVNGKKITLGSKADPTVDEIRVDSMPIRKSEKKVYIAVHKPRNMLSLNSPDDDRASIFDLVKDERHLYPVGRLDFESEGLVF
jgi:23S rRNA pseudouridine2605 synthase